MSGKNVANYKTFGDAQFSNISIQSNGVGLAIYGTESTTPIFSFNPLTKQVNLDGDINITGSTTTSTITVSEFEGGLFNTAGTNIGDAIDLGISGKYVSGGTKYTGIARIAGDVLKRWTFFDFITTQPVTTINGVVGPNQNQLASIRADKIYLNDGTASLPSIVFDGNALKNTGFFRIGTDNIGISTSGVNRIDIGNTRTNFVTGNTVNIGTSGTTSPLNVFGLITGTNLSVSGQLTSTISSGTAPLVVTSTTVVTNLNANLLNGATFSIPGPIGNTTASTGAFTTITAAGLITANLGLTIANGQTVNIGTVGTTSPLNVRGLITGFNGVAITGSTSGTITIQAASGEYNYNLPTSAGTAGQVLTSGGGLTAAMTWTTPGSFTIVGNTVPANATLYVAPALTSITGTNNYHFSYLTAPTLTGTSTGSAYTMYINGAPTGGTITNRFALFVNSGNSSFGGQITSTVTTGTAPFVVASTSNVAFLNASSLNGATFSIPGPIGNTTASTGAFTTITAAGLITANLGLTIANGQTTNIGTSGTTSPLNVRGLITGFNGVAITGSTSGTITIQAASGEYNYNLPTSAGTAGQVLTSGGGLTAAMTWTTAGSFTIVGNTVPANATLYIAPASTAVSGSSNYFFTHLTSPSTSGTTTGSAYTMYINGAPTGGTITNRFALFVNSGLSYFGGNTTINGTTTITSSSINLGGGIGTANVAINALNAITGNTVNYFGFNSTTGNWGRIFYNYVGNSNINNSFEIGINNCSLRFGNIGGWSLIAQNFSIACAMQGAVTHYGNFTISSAVGGGSLSVGNYSSFAGFNSQPANGANSWHYLGGNTNGTGISGNSAGVAFGWNPSAGQGESVMTFYTGGGNDPRLAISSWDGTTRTERVSIRNSGIVISGNQFITGGVSIGSSSPGGAFDSNGLNIRNNNGSFTHFNAQGGSNNFIRGDTTIDANLSVINGSPAITVGTSTGGIGSLHLGNSSHGVSREGDNTVSIYTAGGIGTLAFRANGRGGGDQLNVAISNVTLNVPLTQQSSKSYFGTNSGFIGGGGGGVNFGHRNGGGDGNWCIFYRDDNVAIGSIGKNAVGGTEFRQTSDYRLKSNIVQLNDALDTIKLLKPSRYTMNNGNTTGFIAHELQEILPNMVTGEKDAVDSNNKPIYQQVNLTYLMPFLVAGLQEQQLEINQQKNKIDLLTQFIQSKYPEF